MQKYIIKLVDGTEVEVEDQADLHKLTVEFAKRPTNRHWFIGIDDEILVSLAHIVGIFPKTGTKKADHKAKKVKFNKAKT